MSLFHNDFSVPTWYTFVMEFKSPLPRRNTLEDVLNKSIELAENSTLENDSKLELILLLLDRKQGMQLGDFKIAELEDEKKKITEEFSKKLADILRLLESLKLEYKTVKELSDDNGITGFSVLASRDKNVLDKFVKANNEDDDKTFGTILGFPQTAIETYGTDRAFNIEEELPKDELEKLRDEGLLPFLLFMPSKEHWAEELEWAKENQRLIKEKAPKLYEELIKFGIRI
jgi:hypothetical protein